MVVGDGRNVQHHSRLDVIRSQVAAWGCAHRGFLIRGALPIKGTATTAKTTACRRAGNQACLGNVAIAVIRLPQREDAVPIINRRLSAANCERAQVDLKFLIAYLDHPQFRGDLAIEFRGPSDLGVYDRGFRLAQIMFCADGSYRVRTHRRFIVGTPLQDQRRFADTGDPDGKYATFSVGAHALHSLLQKSHIVAMRSRIKEIPHKEEIGVAHFIAADTMARTDVVVIDREVGDSDTEHRAERLDLLALQETEPATYRFLAIEVKLGNNAELDTATQARAHKRSAVEQVRGYAAQIDRCFDAYADCYRTNIAQKLKLGLLRNGWDGAPTIVPGTQAMLVVAGYSGIAARNLDVIAREHPDLWVKTFSYGLHSEGGVIAGLRGAPAV